MILAHSHWQRAPVTQSTLLLAYSTLHVLHEWLALHDMAAADLISTDSISTASAVPLILL